MNIIISNRSDQPIYEQIESQFRDMILRQQLKPNDPIPSMRALAKDLHVSLITVKKAYENLSRDGLIVTVVGKGSFVANLNQELIKEENQKKIESLLENACALALEAKIEKDVLKDLINLMYEGEF